MNKGKLKYFIIEFGTNIEGLPEHCVFCTKSKYYNTKEIEIQVKDAIVNLGLYDITNIRNIQVRECSSHECVGIEQIEKAYNLIRTLAINMHKNMALEECKRSGIKHPRLYLLFMRIGEYIEDVDW